MVYIFCPVSYYAKSSSIKSISVLPSSGSVKGLVLSLAVGLSLCNYSSVDSAITVICIQYLFAGHIVRKVEKSQQRQRKFIPSSATYHRM